jgi:hypothetical protein
VVDRNNAVDWIKLFLHIPLFVAGGQGRYRDCKAVALLDSRQFHRRKDFSTQEKGSSDIKRPQAFGMNAKTSIQILKNIIK